MSPSFLESTAEETGYIGYFQMVENVYRYEKALYLYENTFYQYEFVIYQYDFNGYRYVDTLRHSGYPPPPLSTNKKQTHSGLLLIFIIDVFDKTVAMSLFIYNFSHIIGILQQAIFFI